MRTIKRTDSMTGSWPLQTHSHSQQARWLLRAKKVAGPALRLFCFAHAGGSAAVYHHWHKQLPANIEVCAVQLPGRGHRISEPVIDDLALLVDSIYKGIGDQFDTPFAFFGHSMGGMLAFELTRLLRRKGLPLPRHLFVSACRAPQFQLGREPIHALPKIQFLEKLRHLNGTPAEVLENTELMDMMEPVLRADFKIVESRQYHQEQPLDIPITAFGGQHDERVSTDYLQGWQQHTEARFTLQLFPGDHFYYTRQNTVLLRQIADLLSLSPRSAMPQAGKLC
jgi:medium-chain acyl-[acyl-carrier-protein] hydrolase